MLLQLLILILFVSGCIEFEEEDSCAEFVEYICTCHSKNQKYNCMELKNIYLDADFEQQEQCALALDDLMYEDAKNNVPCAGSATSVDKTKEEDVKHKKALKKSKDKN